MSRFVLLTTTGLAQGAIIALIALGFLVISKATGVVNFAQGDLVTLGAYVALWAYADLDLPLGVAYGVAVVGLFMVGMVFERLIYAPVRGRSVHVVVIATLGAALVIRALIVEWQGSQPKSLRGPFGLGGVVEIFGARIPKQNLLIIAVTAVLVAVLLYVFNKTQFGRQLRAIAVDRDTARLQGIRAGLLSLLAFGISAALSGVAGVLYAPTQSLTTSLGFGPMLFSFAAAILGGFGRLGGVVVGALLIGLSTQWLSGYLSPDFTDAYPFVIMLLAIALRPQGLFGSEVGTRV